MHVQCLVNSKDKIYYDDWWNENMKITGLKKQSSHQVQF